VSMKFGGATGQIDFSNENSGDGVIRQMIDTKDLVVQQYDGTEVIRFTDGGSVEVKDDLALKSDSAVMTFGASSEVKVVHVADKGLNFKHTATADDKPIVLTLQTGEIDIAEDDVIGAINFQAPDEGTDTDSRLVCAGIEAVSEGDFSSSSNATKLSFKTGASETAAEKMYLTSAGHLMPSGDDSQDLGGASNQWQNIYTGDLHLSNARGSGNEVDGTSGSWTIQEGADDLFLINRETGKKFKFKLEEIE